MKSFNSNLIAALALAGLMVCGTAANAQDASTNKPATAPAAGAGGARRGGQGGPFVAIAEKLNLSDDQKPKYKEALKGLREKMGNPADLTPEERMAKRKEAMTDLDEKMKGILTADQYKIWQTETAKMRNMRGGRRPGAPGGTAPAAGSAPATPPAENN